MIHPLVPLFVWLHSFSHCEANTIGKICNFGDSTCGTEQTCVNSRCECDPKQRRYWTGTKFGCRICPGDYYRTPTRCYRYSPTWKNHSEARADCPYIAWNYQVAPNTGQFYTWSGGIVHHGQGSRAEYKITWVDPRGPTIRHPETQEPLTVRYCSEITIANYRGDPEPTRQTKNGEKESCVSTVFVPQRIDHGRICMADDFCSTKMSYICEFTETSLSGEYATLPSAATTAAGPTEGESEEKQPPIDGNGNDNSAPSALESGDASSGVNPLILVAGVVAVVAVVGAASYFIFQRRRQTAGNPTVSPTHSAASSNVSGSDMYGTA